MEIGRGRNVPSVLIITQNHRIVPPVLLKISGSMKPKEFVAHISAPDPVDLEQNFRIHFGVTYIGIMASVIRDVIK